MSKQKKPNNPNANYAMYEQDRVAKRKAQTAADAPEAPQHPAEQDMPAERQARIDAEYNAKVRAAAAPEAPHLPTNEELSDKLHNALLGEEHATQHAEELAQAAKGALAFIDDGEGGELEAGALRAALANWKANNRREYFSTPEAPQDWQICPKCGAYADMSTHHGKACAEAPQKAKFALKPYLNLARTVFEDAKGSNDMGVIADLLEAKASAEGLAEALKTLFRECVMVHKYWGENCNRAEANAAVTKASAVLAQFEKGTR
jgi:hypothetical protein